MAALRDSKLEKFAQALLINIANGTPRAKAAHQAAIEAGYGGSSVGPNARKRAQRKDVKARMAELARAELCRAEDGVAATLESAKAKLWSIAGPDLGLLAIKTADQIAAIKTLCEINGWNAEKPQRVRLEGRDGGPIEIIDGIGARLNAARERRSRTAIS